MSCTNIQSRVTIIIVTWNKRDDVIKLLNSLLTVGYKNFSVIVVDNASSDDSVVSIKAHPLDVILIENAVNIGGTGGFNTGVRYALDNLEQEYLWLLDNDATVDSESLAALVNAMGQDPSIALAGSKILNMFSPDYIVETGARIDWRTVSVIPFNRNVANKDNEPALFDVDYVAICSALLRDKAIRKVGLMDERYFLLWDDMDWGISFKKAGYRVVAVNDSLIYHPPFTEKRSVVVDNYYGIRNALLTASKNAGGASLCRALLTLCRRAFQLYWLTGLDRQSDAKHLSIKALADFLFNRWGRITLQGRLPSISEQAASVPLWSSLKMGRILVLNSGSASEINETIELIEENCGESVVIDVVIQADRKNLVTTREPGKVVGVDFEAQNALMRNFRVFLRLRNEQYMLAVNPSADRISPFAYVAAKLARYDSKSHGLVLQNTHPFWKVCAAIVLSEIAAIVFFPVVLIRSFAYRMTK